MAVTAYSMKLHAEHALSAYFKVKEFACKGGGDEVVIDDRLVEALTRIRERFAKPVTISSAYRTPAYNASIGGAKDSQHKYGTAADIRVSGVTPREVAVAAEGVLAGMGIAGGVGLYEYAPSAGKSGFTHVDVREKRARWLQASPTGAAKNVTSFSAAQTDRHILREGSRGEDVKALQERLGITADGVFGPKTAAAVIGFQTRSGLLADGIAGPKTWAALGVTG